MFLITSKKSKKMSKLKQKINQKVSQKIIPALNTKLISAVSKGKINKAKIWIKLGATYLEVDNEGNSAGHFAAANNQIDMYEYLFKLPVLNPKLAGYNPNIVNKKGQNTLHLAIINGHLDMVKYLIEERGSHYLALDKAGNSVGHLAAANNRVEIYKYLLTLPVLNPNYKDYDPDIFHKEECTILDVAVFSRCLDMVKYLVEKGDFDVTKTLRDAVFSNCVDMVKYLVEECGVDVTKTKFFPGIVSPEHVEIANYIAQQAALQKENARKYNSPTESKNPLASPPSPRTKSFVSMLQETEIKNDSIESLNKANFVPKTLFALRNFLSSSGISQQDNLNLSYIGNFLTDDVLSEIPAKFPQLAYIDLSLCRSITNIGLSRIIPDCPNLVSCNFTWCDKITDAGVAGMAHLPNLTSLNLTSCSEITDIALESMVAKKYNLQSLNLSRCNKITDNGVKMLADGMKNLIALNLSWCDKITDAAIDSISKLPELAFIDIKNCKQITDIALIKLRHALPTATIMGIDGKEIPKPEYEEVILSGHVKDILEREKSLSLLSV